MDFDTAMLVKPRKRRRRKADPLKPVMKEARARRIEFEKWLSGALTDALGMTVKVSIKSQPKLSPNMWATLKKGTSEYKRLMSRMVNAPLM